MTGATPPISGPPAPCCNTCGPWWRLPLLLALVLAAMVLARSRGGPDVVSAPEALQVAPDGSTGDQANAGPAGETVSLVIDFGDGRTRRYDDVAWHDGMTVERLLAAVQRAGASSTPAPGRLSFAQRGSGGSALLTEIDGVASEGGAGRDWVFFVNDRRADRGFGAYVLRPGDRVLWKFVSTR
jgi:hypothetical protein